MMKRTILIAAVLTAVLGAGVAYATIPGADGTISGCYEKRTGILRVIDAEASRQCLSFETPIAWNARGPKGDTGAPGPSEAYFRAGSGPIAPHIFGDDPGTD